MLFAAVFAGGACVCVGEAVASANGCTADASSAISLVSEVK